MVASRLTTEIDWALKYKYDITSKSFLKHIDNNKDTGYIDSRNYIQIKYDGVIYLAHRIIWELFNSKLKDGEIIDHIDGNRLNNAIENLRVTTYSGNNRNRQLSCKNTIGITGIKYRSMNNGANEYYIAYWSDINDIQQSKYFSITKLGKENALQLAIALRKEMILRRNQEGAGYTALHIGDI